MNIITLDRYNTSVNHSFLKSLGPYRYQTGYQPIETYITEIEWPEPVPDVTIGELVWVDDEKQPEPNGVHKEKKKRRMRGNEGNQGNQGSDR